MPGTSRREKGDTEQKEGWKEEQNIPNTSSLTAVPTPPGGRGSLSSFYCTLKAPERTRCIGWPQASLLPALGFRYLYSYEAKGICLATSFIRVNGTRDTSGLCKLPRPFQSQGWGCQKGHLLSSTLHPPSSLPPDQALLAQPSDFLARLSRLQPERGQLTLLAGALILSRWAGGLHQGLPR